MIKDILFYTSYNQYETKRHFAKKLGEALTRLGINVHFSDQDDPSKIIHFRPDLTFSFHRIFMEKGGQKLLWDVQQIPHLSFLVDPLFYFMDFLKSPFCTVSCVDRFDQEFAQAHGGDRVLFLPHAVEAELAYDDSVERPYDLVFIGSCYDPDNLRAFWQNQYSKDICQIIDEAIERTFADNCTPFYKALKTALDSRGIAENEVDFYRFGYFVDNYLRGKDRLDLISSIKNTKIHVFGGTCWRPEQPIDGWMKYLRRQSNVVLHPAINFLESLELLKKTKICLNSVPSYKNGTHERIFTSLACGVVPITTDNLYVREQFEDGNDLFLYQHTNRQAVNDVIHMLLNDEKKRKQIAESGRCKVMANHTWDVRAKEMLEGLHRLGVVDTCKNG